MNSQNLAARAARHDEEAPVSIPDPLAPLPPLEPAGEAAPAKPEGEIPRLRHALAQLLSRETGEDIAVFHSPVVDTTRLCAIADNIFLGRPWSQ